MKLFLSTGLLAGLTLLSAPLHATVVIAPSAGYGISYNGNEGVNFSAAEVASVPANLATTAGATAIASSQLDLGVHFTSLLNDGRYGNSNSWIGGDVAGVPFAGISLGGTFNLTGFAFGRDNGNNVTDPQTNGYLGQLPDRSLGLYSVQITQVASPNASTPDTGNAITGWVTLGTINYVSNDDAVIGSAFTSYYRHEYGLSATSGSLTATGLRFIVPVTGIGAGTDIDEIEIFGAAVPEPAGSLVMMLGLAGLGLRRRR